MPLFFTKDAHHHSLNKHFSSILGWLCIPLLIVVLLFPFNSADAQQAEPEFSWFGDIRPGFSYVSTNDRTGETSDESTFNTRFRIGGNYQINESLIFQGRIASRFSSNQDDLELLFEDHTGGSGSYPAGTITFDQLFLRWQLNDAVRLTAGRFQARYPLAGFIPKGVDRYYSANMSISHTDGLWLDWNLNQDWKLHAVVSHNGDEGSSHAGRAPLDFGTKDSSRLSFFTNLEHRETGGRWVQREISLSYTPGVVQRDGERSGHLAASTRVMMRLPINIGGVDYWFGGELGYTPRITESGIIESESSTLFDGASQAWLSSVNPLYFIALNSSTLFDEGALAWQVSAYANGIAEDHQLGILYGQVEPDWLISSSFRPNNTLAEARYRWNILDPLTFDFRVRYRTDLFTLENADESRQDFDFYARFTYKF
jgi:hypothetical protein